MKKIFLVFVMLFALTTIVSCKVENDVEHKISITLDAKEPSVEQKEKADWYTVSVKNSSDLQYVVTTIKITDKDYQNAKYILFVNGEKIDSKKYTVEDNVITYKVEDPNWSDFI